MQVYKTLVIPVLYCKIPGNVFIALLGKLLFPDKGVLEVRYEIQRLLKNLEYFNNEDFDLLYEILTNADSIGVKDVLIWRDPPILD